ncbi:MAG: macro domain-containing protein [Acidaminococcus sp.]|nr:macro domain-containing protein [Acidaminococcus sp.]MCI2114406.1 macro domain-containing protein [Acidaminococcus sp.]MCI2116204.1 macro domain-containing protein [Acidaminococcus sp.]
MPFTILRQDITQMKVDAIVNSANKDLSMGGGTCGSIFKAAGTKALQEACAKLGPIRIGDAVITPGFHLPAKYIIHTAGPVYNRLHSAQCEKALRSAYEAALQLALRQHLKSIAFPLISTGLFGYPKAEALQIAVSEIKQFLELYEMDVYLVIYDKDSFIISESLMGDVQSFIDEHYVKTHEPPLNRRRDIEINALMIENRGLDVTHETGALPEDKSLLEQLEHLDEPFNQALLRLIDQKKMKDSDVYKKANIDRKLFSKIRKGKGYMPSKKTILALAVALELTLPETDALLAKAGYTLSDSIKFDVILQYFIVNRNYDIFTINEVLFKFDQPLLGNVG